MKNIFRNALRFATVILLAGFSFWVGGCGVDSERLWAMPLQKAPGEVEWNGALVLKTVATGGATSQVGESEVDKDSVHKATASCHHGSAGVPVKVEVKAFYTPEKLYIRVAWPDPTMDLGPAWTKEGGRWKAASMRRDGLGILWGRGRNFNCTSACHLRDWRQAGARAFADYQMAAPGKEPLDFWIWRAGRDRPEGTAEDRKLLADPDSAAAIAPFEVENSVFAARGGEKRAFFSEEDGPVKTPDSVTETWAPGFIASAKEAGRVEVEGYGVRGDGLWTLTLSRALKGAGQGDVEFTPGGEYTFGLAVLDGVVRDHNAVGRALTLVLAKPPKEGAGD